MVPLRGAPPELLKPKEVAEILRCDLSTVYRLCRNDRLPSIKHGSFLRIPRDAVYRYMTPKPNNQ